MDPAGTLVELVMNNTNICSGEKQLPLIILYRQSTKHKVTKASVLLDVSLG